MYCTVLYCRYTALYTYYLYTMYGKDYNNIVRKRIKRNLFELSKRLHGNAPLQEISSKNTIKTFGKNDWSSEGSLNGAVHYFAAAKPTARKKHAYTNMGNCIVFSIHTPVFRRKNIIKRAEARVQGLKPVYNIII